jgi:chemotaxis protein MotB
MAKHEVHEEHENHERWLVSFADFMTLLFALFVVLYAMSAVDQKKVRQVENAVRWAMHIEGTGNGGELQIFNDIPDIGSRTVQILPPIPGSLSSSKAQALVRRVGRHSGGAVHLTAELTERRLVVRMSASDAFEPGSARLLPSALPSIDFVVSELAQLNETVRVEGHTDSLRPRGMDNWELSVLRAAAVARYVEAARLVPHERLAVAGYADTKPLSRGDDEAARARNRRIDFVIELGGEPDPPPSGP